MYSLRANTYSLNLNPEAADEDFLQSLRINPYNATTLSRRARHLMKVFFSWLRKKGLTRLSRTLTWPCFMILRTWAIFLYSTAFRTMPMKWVTINKRNTSVNSSVRLRLVFTQSLQPSQNQTSRMVSKYLTFLSLKKSTERVLN